MSAAFIVLAFHGAAVASGLFGPPQPVSKEAGGIHTGIGYWYHEDRYVNGTEHVILQNQIYTQAGYGAHNYWEIYGRIGISDLKMLDAFSPVDPSTTASRNDFEDNWKFFGTLGVKGFYPFNDTFGVGTFLQGTYSFSDFTDSVAGTRNGVPYTAKIKVKNMWDVNFGIGFQALVPYGIKLYIGPYLYYAEAKVSPSTNTPGLQLTAETVTLKNKTNVGGFTGIEIPIARGFRLNVEGQYSERLSAGAAITLTY
ncbi:MAG: hypothetical protein ACE14T_00425 [Syntrophales bacterium]